MEVYSHIFQQPPYHDVTISDNTDSKAFHWMHALFMGRNSIEYWAMGLPYE